MLVTHAWESRAMFVRVWGFRNPGQSTSVPGTGNSGSLEVEAGRKKNTDSTHVQTSTTRRQH